MTQRERIAKLIPQLRVPAEAVAELTAVVGEAQNGPPQGAADGTVSPQLWLATRDAVLAVDELIHVLGRVFAELPAVAGVDNA